MSFGIVATGHALGRPVTVAELVATTGADADKLRGWGYRRLYRAEDGVGITDLATRAADAALRRAAVTAGELDLVVVAVPDVAEYLYWDAAAALQGRLAARRAEALLINQACGGGVSAFDTVAGRFATHPGHRTALVVAANRVVDAYWDRTETGTSLSSDGAVAAVLRRDHPACAWLATETISDGRYADFMRMESGGAAHPFAPDRKAPGVAPLLDRMDTFFEGDGAATYEFVTLMHTRNREVLERVCARTGTPLGSVERVLYLHDNLKSFNDLAKELGVPLHRTNAGIAMEFGHFGTADQLLSLERLLATGELVTGDVVALLSMGSGAHWTCTLLRV
ncbi:3-oxoacyl-[acyl-carrier-protein] synthase III C-terminal domain-containing protein [Streptomyces sp. MST-110588]|uniref:3-oxoacyl-ACP synthase III family protein n=1 Tax=Streptomyces sp. MST-110588 TaxID=2833628 RepID=UPI001F5DB186|nr:3-oxoacyl-[acyl-carrier-protein] synthase III C-terminal domain-containing protein [Streptomyces sp. MST-110588]UNO40115.1 3-oxoacyl-ACP synthase [Streptomyces sp. MST-110588]